MRSSAWRHLLALLVLLGASAAARAAPPIEAYGKLPALDLVRLSPSGDKIAFVAVDGETRKLFVRTVGGDALLTSVVGTSKVRDLEWAGDDYVLISVSATLKFGTGELDKWSYSTRGELVEIIIVNVRTRTISQMFHGQELNIFPIGQMFNTTFIDGKWYDFVDVVTVGHDEQIYRVDLESGKYSPIPGYEIGGYVCFIDTKGLVAARARYDQSTRQWSLLVGGRGKDVVVERKSSWNTVSMAGSGRAEGSVLVAEDGLQKDTVDEYPISPGAAPTRLFDGLDVDRFLRDPRTHLLIGATLPGGRGVALFDPTLQQHYNAVGKAFAGLRVTLESLSAGMGKIVVKTDGGDDPGTYWLVNMTTGKADDLMAAYPSIQPADVGRTSQFAYHAADGVALEGILTLPPGSATKRLPLVVMPHGGPIGVRDELGFNYWAQAFASRGYAVFQPNYRGSGGYGAAFRQAGFGQWGHKMLTDMSDGVEALAKAGTIDDKRVCIVGASYGGYAALAGVTIQQGVYRCAVSVSGISDVGAIMVAAGDSPSLASGRYHQAVFGASFAGDGALGKISPIRHADDADAPILLIHGKDDTVVPFVHSLSMDRALSNAGKTVEFLPLDGEDHWWSREKTRVQILQASVAFVQKYNPAS